MEYPGKLMDHLRSFEENGENLQPIELAKRWKFKGCEDLGEASAKCPCGHQGIRYLMYIVHENLGCETFVGSECIKIFEERLQNVMRVARNLMVRGVNATYTGLFTEGRGKVKLNFAISGNHGLARKQRDFEKYFQNFPVDNKNGRWICRVFPKEGQNHAREYADNHLTVGRKYLLKLKMARWETSYGTGISLIFISCVAK